MMLLVVLKTVAFGAGLVGVNLSTKRASATTRCAVARLCFWASLLAFGWSIWGPLWSVEVLRSPALLQPSKVPLTVDWRPAVFTSVWALGSVWGLWRLAADLWIVRDVVRRAVPFRGSDSVLLSEYLAFSGPFTTGWTKPVIVLPSSAVDWSARRLQAVLAHETAHIDRSDWLQHVLMRLFASLFWPNLLLHVFQRRAAASCEQACDDRAISGGLTADHYARELVDLAKEFRFRVRHGAAMAGTSLLESRVTALLDPKTVRGEPPGSYLGFGCAAIVVAACLAGAALPVPISYRMPAARAYSVGDLAPTRIEVPAHTLVPATAP